MKTPITTIILLATLALNVFAQQEIPMFFDNELALTAYRPLFSREVAYSPDGSKIAVTFNIKKIAIWDVATGRLITRLAGHNDFINNIAFSPNGRQLLSCSGRDSTIKIWDAASGELIRSIQSNAIGVSFSPDGSRIVGRNTSENSVKIWNTSNGNEIRTLEHTERLMSVTYSPDGRQILTASYDGIRIWDAVNGQILRTINSGTRYGSASYSPNGQIIAAYQDVRRNGAIQIFNVQTGQEIRSFPVNLSPMNIIFSPDGRQFLVNAWPDDNTKTIKIFDVETVRELRSFINSNDVVTFSRDGRSIITNSRSFDLTIANNTYGASYATLLDATTGRVTGTIGYGPLNVGARAYADLQIARYLNDTAAVNRHETVLQFITGRGNATRAQIETFYRDNVRAMISGVVDREFQGITVPSVTVTEVVKNPLFAFLRSPDQASFNAIRTILNSIEAGRRLQETYDQYMWAYNLFSALEEVAGTASESADALRNARVAQNNLNEIRRTLRAPNDAPIDWSNFRSAYERILNGFNPELVRRMR